ncbi:hypothetical protein [Pseudomaricurvus alkylphenolicus]|uniref:hypothetical protein n=1 Tax=Pseudomaricurvus alkylphenolicus TaxID=1306991 RepID=UPI00197FA449|nr:hypothetical protein [Pseudomaricurvus alkylphenolicus]
MADSDLRPERILAQFNDIAEANNWRALHTPLNLAQAISVEAGELLAEFQCEGEPDRSCVAAEVADLQMYILALCQKLDIDLAAAVEQKQHYNRERFLTGK